MRLWRSKPTDEELFVADRRVLIHFTNQESSLDGFVVKQTPDAYWLQQAQLLESKNREFDLEGTVIVPRTKVFFVQVLERSEA